MTYVFQITIALGDCYVEFIGELYTYLHTSASVIKSHRNISGTCRKLRFISN